MKIALIIEIVGAMVGLIYLYLEYKASFWLWSAGIFMSLFYVYIYYHGKFYADMATYTYYLGANVYGLILWKKGSQNSHKEEVGFSHVSKKKIPLLTAILLLLWLAIYIILSEFTDSPVALGDSFTTALSVIAMWLMAKKHVDHWLLWIVVNVISCGLYIWKGLYPTAVLFVVYTVVSVLGYFRWKRMVCYKELPKHLR
jgi:nicotinamide mononucleotide transporter